MLSGTQPMRPRATRAAPMRRRRRLPFGALSLLLSSCLDYAAPRAPAVPLRLREVDAPTGSLDALGRVPALRLRFDRAVEVPAEDDVVLVAGAPSDALRGDIARLPLSASTLARRVPSSLQVDPTDPTSLRLTVARALLPETELALVVSARVRAADGGALAEDLALALRVAGAARCGALATLALPGAASARPGAIPVRFDRGVRGAGAPFTLRDARGAEVPADARLDCFDDEGYARCGWITPRVALARGTYAVALGDLRARNDARCEAAALRFEVDATIPLGDNGFDAPPCAPDERRVAGVCAAVGAVEVRLRVATRAVAFVRARALPGDQGDAREFVSAPGTVLDLRLRGLRPLTRHAVSLWAMDARGGVTYAALGAFDTVALQGRVRISEVLARPRDAPAQEFVELVSDDDAPVSLAGWSLVSGTARTVFGPDAWVPAHGRAVVVGAGFDVRGAGREPPVAAGAAVIRLRGALAGRGLRDDGADLTLRDARGAVVSAFPGGASARAPREGVSLARAATDLDDEDPAAWSYDAEGGATPGASDRVR